MSTHPSLEARLRAQEHRQINLDARLEELTEGMEASYKQISTYLGKIEDQNTNIETRLGRLETRLGSVETDITDIKTRLGSVETLLIQILERLPKAP